MNIDLSDATAYFVWLLPCVTILYWLFAVRLAGNTRLPEMSGSARAKKAEFLRESVVLRLTYPAIQSVAHVLAVFRPADPNDPMMRRLASAGEPAGLCPQEFLALGAFSGIAMPLVGRAALAYYIEEFGWGSIVAFAAFGAAYPLLWLSERTRKRRGQIVRALPHVLDNLTMSMEAGLNFASALDRLLAESTSDTPIEQELRMVRQEVHLAKTMAEALSSFAERVDSPDVRTFVGAVVQGERMGTPLGKILRVQAEALRTKRYQRAEKLAGEAPVKMLFPLLFIMGAVILTVFGGTIVRALKGELL